MNNKGIFEKKKRIVFWAVLLMVILVILLASCTSSVDDCRVLGGQIYLADEEVQQILKDDYGITCKYEAMGSFQMVAPETSYEGVDAVWVGSKSLHESFGQNHPGTELDHDTIFITFMMNVTWTEYARYAEATELIRQEGPAYTIDMTPITYGIINDMTWSDLGVPTIPGYLSAVRYSAPESSGGGLSTLMLLGSTLTGSPPREIRLSDLPELLPQLQKLWDSAGQQADSSPENFDEFLIKGWPWVITTESLFIGWLNGLDPESRDLAMELLVGVYPQYTMSTDHVLIALTPTGQTLLDAFRTDHRLHQIGWERYGMRIGIGLDSIGAKPGDTDIPWILAQPKLIPDPKQEVFDLVKEQILR